MSGFLDRLLLILFALWSKQLHAVIVSESVDKLLISIAIEQLFCQVKIY